MPHPFFDVTIYPMHRPEASALLDELANAFANGNAIDLIYQQCGDNLPALFLGQAHPLIWKEALQNLTSRGFLRKLLDLVQPQFQNSVQMQKVIREVINAESAEEVTFISQEMLVLDRTELRNRLKELASDTNPTKVLLVRGSAKTGKTWGRHIFERFATDQAAPSVYIYPEIAVTVSDLIDQLFAALGAMDEIPDAFTTDEAWYRKVCAKLADVATKKNKRLWIAVDDLGPDPDGAPLMDAEIKKFCDVFALNMLNQTFRNNFRLMLIHYPEGSPPTKWKREFWTEDRTSDADIQPKHIVELLKKWAISRDRTIVEDQLTQIANEVITAAEAPAQKPNEQPPPRLQRIHDELRSKLASLESKPQ
jgi:hypothetical protein